MGISSQNTLLNNYLTVRPILTNNIPSYSTQQAEDILGEKQGSFRKTSHLNNFLTVQPIFNSNITIDSAGQVNMSSYRET